MAGAGNAQIYRMVMDKHVCPWGLRALDLLQRKGFTVKDHHLATRAETDAFKAQHGVETTPQIFIDGQRIGGYTELRAHLGMKPLPSKGDVSYRPVIAIFGMAALMALGLSWYLSGLLLTVQAAEWFVSISMCLLALQKLQDVSGFATMFLGYDLLARRWVPYATLYPFGEALAGVLMTAHALPWLSVPISLFIGTVGAVSVYKAVYIDRRELKCACVGGSSNVPLGFVSLTENLFMIAMALWMGAKLAGWITV